MSIETLKLKVAAEKAIQTAHKSITPIKLFTTSFNALESQKGAAITVPVFDIGAAGDFNADSNNYAGKKQDVAGVDVNLDKHLVKSVFYTDRDDVECDVPFAEKMGEGIAKSLSRGIVETTLGLITNVNVSNKVTMTADKFADKKAVASLYAECDKKDIAPEEAVLVLSPTCFANLLSQLDADVYGGSEAIRDGIIEGLYGFKGVVMSNALPEGANGAIVHAEAIGVAGRYLVPDASAYAEVGMVTDEATGLTIGFRRFSDPATGKRYVAGDVLFGAKLLQPTKIVRIVQA